jgi:hypothetical protein
MLLPSMAFAVTLAVPLDVVAELPLSTMKPFKRPAVGNLPVYNTNWSRVQTSNPQDQAEAIDTIAEFFPASAPSNLVVERVYWFGATDFGGGASSNLLTQVLSDGSTLGQLWRNKCDSL